MKHLTRKQWRNFGLPATSAVFLLGLLFCLPLPNAYQASRYTCASPIRLGSEELIVVAADDGTRRQVLAKIDTGAKVSSLDLGLARQLGLDISGEDTILMKSAFGTERRPLVEIKLHIAGKRVETVMTVADRSSLSADALIGRDDLAGFLVDVSASQLTTPDAPPYTDQMSTAACKASTDRAPFDVFWQGSSEHENTAGTHAWPTEVVLLAMLPLAATVTVFFRTLIGLQTFGLFAPMLLAAALLQSGFLIGFGLFALVLGVGILVHPLLRRLHLTRVPRLSLLLIVVILILMSAERVQPSLMPGAMQSATLPLVVTAAIVEQFWTSWEQGQLTDALKLTVATGIVTTVISLVLSWQSVQSMAVHAPISLALAGAGTCLLMGRYRGLRLAELWRFRSLRGNIGKDAVSIIKLRS